jgi:hypothetical protein
MTKEEFDKIWLSHKNKILLIHPIKTKDNIENLKEAFKLQEKINWLMFSSVDKEHFIEACASVEKSMSLIFNKHTNDTN